jgi:hypothetical protein
MPHISEPCYAVAASIGGYSRSLLLQRVRHDHRVEVRVVSFWESERAIGRSPGLVLRKAQKHSHEGIYRDIMPIVRSHVSTS